MKGKRVPGGSNRRRARTMAEDDGKIVQDCRELGGDPRTYTRIILPKRLRIA
jgi:hypothetical protein